MPQPLGRGKNDQAESGAPAAQATMRRSVASAASKGTATIHGMSHELRPPVSQAQYVTSPAKFAAEARCAAANFPVRDRKMAMAIGDSSQRKAVAVSSDGLPLTTR